MIDVGIIGGAGYTAGELIRLLLQHPAANIVFVHSSSHAGEPVHAVHRDLLGDSDLTFTDQISYDIDVLFICAGHGKAIRFLEEHEVPARVKVIDLSQDFRNVAGYDIAAHNVRTPFQYNGRPPRTFVYGLPELQREAIRTAQNIANPGCFATAFQLALLPLAKAGLLEGKRAICYPGLEDRLSGAEICCESVVCDGNVITSRGMGTSVPFGLALVAYYLGKEKADALAAKIVYRRAD